MTVPADRSFQTLGSFVLRYKWRVLTFNLVRMVATLLMAIHPYFLAEFVSSAGDKDRAFRYLMLLLVSGGAHAVLWTGCDFATSRWINPLTYEFKRIGFEAFWKNDYELFVDRPSGKVGSYINDLQRHSLGLWDSFHYGFLPMLTSLPVYLILFLQVSWTSSVGYGVFLLLAALLLTAASRPVRSTQHALTDTVATANGRVFDSYANFVNVFSFRGQRKEIVRNDGDTRLMAAGEVRASTALSAYWGAASVLVRGALWSFVILYNWHLFDRGDISFAALIISITVLLDFTSQYWNVVHNLGVWVDSSSAYRAAYNYLFPGKNIVTDQADSESEVSTEPFGFTAETLHSAVSDAAELPDSSGLDVASALPAGSPVVHGWRTNENAAAAVPIMNVELELRNLSFAYPDRTDTRVLTDINLRVRRGEKIGVVGRSGEGKSTLIKILLGFYEPASGEILIDGQPAEPERLRALTSYVPQDTSLFQESVAYNIAYASDRPLTQAQIQMAAHQAHIGNFIESLPEGYNTMVGERGIKLSLGQRQRIALARAFVKSSDLLILDEATSALDSETEALIQDSLEDLLSSRAAIVIAHRLATLDSMDRIIVVDGGRIVEEGTKQSLLDLNGMFADLWTRQQTSGEALAP